MKDPKKEQALDKFRKAMLIPDELLKGTDIQINPYTFNEQFEKFFNKLREELEL